MQRISYDRHRFPPEVIRHAIWLYLRFTLSYRDVEELLAERGLDVSYETVRRWVDKFGSAYARNLRRLRPRPADTWHLNEMVVSIQGRRMYLWRAVDSEGEFGEDRGEPMSWIDIKAEFVVAAAEVLDERMPCIDHSGRAEPFQSTHRP